MNFNKANNLYVLNNYIIFTVKQIRASSWLKVESQSIWRRYKVTKDTWTPIVCYLSRTIASRPSDNCDFFSSRTRLSRLKRPRLFLDQVETGLLTAITKIFYNKLKRESFLYFIILIVKQKPYLNRQKSDDQCRYIGEHVKTIGYECHWVCHVTDYYFYQEEKGCEP